MWELRDNATVTEVQQWVKEKIILNMILVMFIVKVAMWYFKVDLQLL